MFEILAWYFGIGVGFTLFTLLCAMVLSPTPISVQDLNIIKMCKSAALWPLELITLFRLIGR